MNSKKKPDYDPEEILQSLTAAAVEIYAEEKSLRSVADELDLNPIKVRKLLITAGVYESDMADKVNRLKRDGNGRQDRGGNPGSLQGRRRKHKGERVFIVATGPSLTMNDLKQLKNEYTISMNSIVSIFPKTDFRPTYYICVQTAWCIRK